jgi:hypothetical protein
MVLDHDVGGPALTPDVGMEIGGEEARRVGAAHRDLGIRPQIVNPNGNTASFDCGPDGARAWKSIVNQQRVSLP